MDWKTWLDGYDVADSWMAQRLRTVQERIRAALDTAPPGPLNVISLCSGDGRDLLPVLAEHPRRGDVRARLVELDPRNAAAASQTARAAGLDQVDVVTGDASLIDHYHDLAPVDLMLICGVFGNISDGDIGRTIGACDQLCKSGGTVIWTRHRGAPDRVPMICERFGERGFALTWLSDPDVGYGVGVHEFTGTPRPPRSGVRMFEFIGYDVIRHSGAER